MPVLDALTYLIIHFEELEQEQEAEQWKLYANHISRLMSNPAQDADQQKAQSQFLESLEPKAKVTKPKVTDYDKLEQLRLAQEQSMKQLN